MAIFNESYSSFMVDFFNSRSALSKTIANASLGCSKELIGINVNAVRTGLAENTVFAQRIMAAKDPFERLALFSARFQTRLDDVISMAQRITGVTVKAQSQLSNEVQQQMEDFKRNVTSLENDARIVPPIALEAIANVVQLDVAGTPHEIDEPVQTTLSAPVDQTNELLHQAGGLERANNEVASTALVII